ncbi:MAG: AAA family ATPase [Succinatimonas hippei]|nr:AAA family ATPase [Succinatimonas hippei]
MALEVKDLYAELPGFLSQQPAKSVTAPAGSPSIGDKWAVLDPVSGSVSQIKVWLPFRSAVRMQRGFNSHVVELKKLPNMGVWVTVQSDPRAAALVPDFDPAYRPEWSHVFKILQVLKNGNRPGRGQAYLASGEAGTGKTSCILWVHAVLGIPLVQFNCTESSDITDLFVRQIPSDGKWVNSPGAALRAVRHGWSLLVDEIDLAPAALPPALNDLVEGYAYSVPGYKIPVVRANGNFHLFATGNTGVTASEKAVYQGRNLIDASFRSRCLCDHYANPTESDICALIKARYGDTVNPPIAEATANFAVNLNKQWGEQGIDNFGPRQIFQFIDALEASKEYLVNPLGYALFSAIPAMEEDASIRSDVWNVFISSFAAFLNGADLESTYASRFQTIEESGEEDEKKD